MRTEALTPERKATHQELVRSSRHLAPVIRQRAEETERARRVLPESIEQLISAGFARVLVPKRFGGLEMTHDTSFDMAVEIGRACASTGWCASLLAGLSYVIAMFPEEAQEAVWANGPDVRFAGAVVPSGQVERVDGGYRLSGKYGFTSGIDHAEWLMIGGILRDGDHQGLNHFLVPRKDCSIEDKWFAAGMKGTGSKTAVLDGAFVPATHRIWAPAMLEGSLPGGRSHANPMYSLPFVMTSCLTFIAPMLGAARGLYDDFVATAHERKTERGSAVRDRWSVQETVTRASVDLDIAEMLIRRNLDRARSAGKADLVDRGIALRNYTRATELILDTVGMLLRKSGSRGFMESHLAQRVWRDVNMMASHTAFDPEYNMTYFGRLQLGLERDPAMALF